MIPRGKRLRVLVGSVLPSGPEPSHCATLRCLSTKAALGCPTQALQKVSLCVHKKNKCGIRYRLVCALV